MSGIMVRDAEVADEDVAKRVEADAFAELRRIYVPKRPVPTQTTGEQVMFSRLVVECDGEIVGAVRWGIEGDRLHLRALAVVREYRRRGVARAIVNHCLDLARRKGLRAVSAYTVVETGNVAVFERLGFVVVREDVDGFATTPKGAAVREAYLELAVG